MGNVERLFFGVGIPTSLADQLERHLTEGVMGPVPLRLIPARNWHVTVRFLGATSTERLRVVQESIAVSSLPPAFSVRLKGWGAFPRADRARVFWTGIVDRVGGFAHLNRVAEGAAVDAGYEPDRRPYSPHLTLGRLRIPADLRPLIAALPSVDLEMIVTTLTLYRSDLSGGDVRYEAKTTIALPRE